MRFFTFFFSAIFLIFTGSYFMFGQVPPTIEQEEAPATVWDMKIGDSDVDLYIAGYWKIGIMGGLSVESGPEGIVFPAAFPGLTDFNFYQEPDITISLWLMNRYYLETSFLEGFDKNTYAIGYRGMEGEVVQSVRIGNSDISIEEYKGISVPAPKYNTPGISAAFQTGMSTHDLLIRYDPTSEYKKIFLGEYEVTEELLEAGAYSRGQYFILPDDQIDFLEVYIADDKGIYSGDNGKSYSKAEDGDISYSLSQGTLSFEDLQESEVLVYYEKNTLPVGDSSLGRDFVTPLVNGEPDPAGTPEDFGWTETDSWYSGITYESGSAVSLNGRKALRIFNPGKFSPFEIMNKYAVQTNLPDEQWRSEVFLADNSRLEADDSDDYEFHLDSEKALLSIYNIEDTDPRSHWTRYPLAGNYAHIYGGEEKDRALSGRSILISVRNSTGLTLGPGVVPGSEQIFINGYETGAAQVDYDSGEITFSRYIYPQDRIEVIYRTETTDLSGGDLLVAQGNRFYPSENLQFHLAEMFRWNISKSSSTTGESSSPGGLTVAGGMLYDNENLSIELTASGGFTTPDTTGYLKLLGMEESGYDFSVGAALAVPGPETIWDGTGSLNNLNRDSLIFTDFYSTDGLGHYYLNNYNWPSAEADSSQEGPSIAARLPEDSVNFSGNVLVLDYSLEDGNWSAGDLLLSSEGPVDLSNFTALSLFLKSQNSQGEVNLKILLGENGESADFDGDGFTEEYDSTLIVDLGTATFASSDDQWKEFQYTFSPSERKKLTKSRSLRFLIEETGTADSASGRILAGGVHLEGSVFHTLQSEDKVSISETDDETVLSPLASAFPEVIELFHSSDEEQKVLKINWKTLSAGESWEAETYTSPVSSDSYNSFSFYINNDTDSLSGTYDFSLTDSRDRGYHFTYSPNSTGWKKITLSLEEESVSVSSGGILSSVLVDEDKGELSRFSVTGSDTSDGTLYLDELHYWEPTFTLNGDVEFNTEYSHPGVIASSATGFPLLSDFSFNNQLSYSGSTVLSEQAEGFNTLENYTSLGITLLVLSLEGTVKVNWSPEATDLAGSHKLQFPQGFPYISFSDSYSRSGSNDQPAASRSNTLRFTVPDSGSVALNTSANGSEDNLIQNWEAATEWSITDKTALSAKGRLEQYSLNTMEERGNYFSNWIYDYQLIVPVDENVNTRSFDSSLSFTLYPQPVGFVLSPNLSYTTAHSPISQHNTSGGFILSVPVEIIDNKEDPWKITPTYSRSFSENRATSNTDSFEDGFYNMFSDLKEWIPLTSFIPFYELFAPASIEVFSSETEFLDSASYAPEFSLELSRKFGSEIYDLFLPYSFETSVKRNFSKEDDSYSSVKNLSFTFKQSAVNLFGHFGVYEKFDFYDSEDISSSLQFNFESTDEESLAPKELIYQNYFSFYGQKNSVFTLENKLETNFTESYLRDTVDFKFLWKMDMRDSFSLDFINRIIDKEHYWSHEETLQFSLTKADPDNSVEISGKHLSTLHVPGLGALRGWLTLAFYREPELFRAGFEAGLEMEMSF